MSSRKKLTLAMVSLILVIAALVVALTTVLAAKTQTVTTDTITVTYHAKQVEATVSAKYAFYKATRSSGSFSGCGTAVSGQSGDMKVGGSSSGATSITFTAGQAQQTTGNTLKPTSAITFNDTKDVLIFTYTFKNNDTANPINLALVTTTTGSTNVTVKYCSTISTTLTDWKDSYADLANADKVVNSSDSSATQTIYIMAYVINLDIDATLKIAFTWTLTNV